MKYKNDLIFYQKTNQHKLNFFHLISVHNDKTFYDCNLRSWHNKIVLLKIVNLALYSMCCKPTQVQQPWLDGLHKRMDQGENVFMSRTRQLIPAKQSRKNVLQNSFRLLTASNDDYGAKPIFLKLLKIVLQLRMYLNYNTSLKHTFHIHDLGRCL